MTSLAAVASTFRIARCEPCGWSSHWRAYILGDGKDYNDPGVCDICGKEVRVQPATVADIPPGALAYAAGTKEVTE